MPERGGLCGCCVRWRLLPFFGMQRGRELNDLRLGTQLDHGLRWRQATVSHACLSILQGTAEGAS